MIKIEIDKFDSKKQQQEAIKQILKHPLKKKCSNCFYYNQIGNFEYKCIKFNCVIPNAALKLEEDQHECAEYEKCEAPF